MTISITMSGVETPEHINFNGELFVKQSSVTVTEAESPSPESTRDLINKVRAERKSFAGGSTHDILDLLIDIVERLEREKQSLILFPYPPVVPVTPPIGGAPYIPPNPMPIAPMPNTPYYLPTTGDQPTTGRPYVTCQNDGGGATGASPAVAQADGAGEAFDWPF
jgi:hypothetical protein